jgi:pimeloyl-ACP methyl ester carboxylesterase
MLYFHGIGEDIRMILSEPHMIRKHLRYNVLCVEYPGYGINFGRGICTEQQMVQDSFTVLEFLLSTGLTMQEIVVYGRSMGTGVAANLAHTMKHMPFYKVILVSPYSSIRDLAHSKAGCIGSHLINDHFNTASKIP